VCQREVRQRTDTEQRQLARRLAAATDDLVGCEPLGALDTRLREQLAAQAALAVDVGGVLPLLQERFACALVDGDVLAADEREGVLRVLDLVVERDVAGDDGDGLDRESVGETGQQDGLRVVARRSTMTRGDIACPVVGFRLSRSGAWR